MSTIEHEDSQPAEPADAGKAREVDRTLEKPTDILSGARVYLSGPMDFVASREEERRTGWRTRVGQFLHQFGATVYDPWDKPSVAGMPHYGKEDEFSTRERQRWTFEDSADGDRIRAELGGHFWHTVHIDLRMVDTADFVIAYCPTNIYSVGTVHEVVMARLQCKPVLFVSPPVAFPAIDALERHLDELGDTRGRELLGQLETEAPLRRNPDGIPSMWYMALLDGTYFFDGFGFAGYAERFGWAHGALDDREERCPAKRPLLPYLSAVHRQVPPKYDLRGGRYVENPDWLLFRPDHAVETGSFRATDRANAK